MQQPIKSIYKGDLGEIRFSSVRLIEKKFGKTQRLSLKYVLRGKENYVVDGKAYALKEGELLFFSEGVDYTAFTEDNRLHNGFCIDLDPAFLAFSRRDLFGEESLFELKEEFKAVKLSSPNPEFLRQLHGLFGEMNAGSSLGLEGCLNELMLLYLHLESDFSRKIASIPLKKQSVRKELFCRLLVAQNFIHDHKTDSISLDSIARASGISKFYLQRLFSTVFGKSPSQYLESIRMEEAVRQMQHSSRSISEVCYSLGYNDLAYFSRRFKQYTGLSPRNFQKGLQ